MQRRTATRLFWRLHSTKEEIDVLRILISREVFIALVEGEVSSVVTRDDLRLRIRRRETSNAHFDEEVAFRFFLDNNISPRLFIMENVTKALK